MDIFPVYSYIKQINMGKVVHLLNIACKFPYIARLLNPPWKINQKSVFGPMAALLVVKNAHVLKYAPHFFLLAPCPRTKSINFSKGSLYSVFRR
jgi:hypothetical protein